MLKMININCSKFSFCHLKHDSILKIASHFAYFANKCPSILCCIFAMGKSNLNWSLIYLKHQQKECILFKNILSTSFEMPIYSLKHSDVFLHILQLSFYSFSLKFFCLVNTLDNTFRHVRSPKNVGINIS